MNPNFLLKKSDLAELITDWTDKFLGTGSKRAIKPENFEGEHRRFMTILSFVLFYGAVLLFLLFYGIIILIGPFGEVNLATIILAVAVYALQHLFSFILHLKERMRPVSGAATKQMFEEPFIRVMPIYVIAVVMGFVGGISFLSTSEILLFVFMVAKMYYDVKAHLRKHSVENKSI